MARLSDVEMQRGAFAVSFDGREILTQRIAYKVDNVTVEYVGYALPGAATTAAKWAIKKITYNGAGSPALVSWADGTALHTKVWDDRATYDYSA